MIAVLFSGGIDSTVAALMAHKTGDLRVLILFNYGQAAFDRQYQLLLELSKQLGVAYEVVSFPYPQYTNSVLFHEDAKPSGTLSREDLSTDGRKLADIEDFGWIEGRNPLMMLQASIVAKYMGCNVLYTGTQIDPIEWQMNQDAIEKGGQRACDTTVQMISSVNSVIYQSFSSPFFVQAPLSFMTKEQVVKLGLSLGLDLDKTYSCEYGTACGQCSQCQQVAHIRNNIIGA